MAWVVWTFGEFFVGFCWFERSGSELVIGLVFGVVYILRTVVIFGGGVVLFIRF